MAIHYSDAQKQLFELNQFDLGTFNLQQIDLGKHRIFNAIVEPPTYVGGESVGFGDGKKGYIKLLSSGTLILTSDLKVDITLVGPGDDGYDPYSSSSGYVSGGDGGNGGEIKFLYNETLKKGNIQCYVDRYSTKIGWDFSARKGGGFLGGEGGQTSGVGGSGYENGKNGIDSYTLPFDGDVSPFYDMPTLGASGGGGGAYAGFRKGIGGKGGQYWGGDGGSANSASKADINGKDAKVPNTGSGGGGGSGQPNNLGHGGKGSSGVIYIRWGY